jgi:precorrin-6B methylase 1
MARIKVKVLSKGDSVISITEKAIAVQRKNGEVDIVPIISEGNTFRVDVENIVTITYGNNSVETTVENDNGDVIITTF